MARHWLIVPLRSMACSAETLSYLFFFFLMRSLTRLPRHLKEVCPPEVAEMIWVAELSTVSRKAPVYRGLPWPGLNVQELPYCAVVATNISDKPSERKPLA